MNRKERRAARRHGQPADARRTESAGDQVSQLFSEAVACEQARKFDNAARAYESLLQLKPDHAQACNNLGRVMQALGKPQEASAYFARALVLMPQLLEQQYAGICATLVALCPPLGDALRRQAAAWPRRLAKNDLFRNAGLVAIAANPLLLHLLQSIPVRDVAFEHALTALRLSLLTDVANGKPIPDVLVAFGCALAKQCFINEYVFATTAEEDAQVSRLKSAVAGALGSGASIAPMQLAVLAMYSPLHALLAAQKLLAHPWAPPIDGLITQQIREPTRERELRDTIPRLTSIDDEVSRRVQQQYEENPYPRWIHVAGQVQAIPLDQYLRDLFPGRGFASLGKTEALDVLVAGCGTGQIAVASAQKYLGARVLALDLSLSSLRYAKRKTPPALAARIDYAQADILKLASIDRRFDMIDASGVLHHMTDPLEGWRILLGLLRPGGFMHLGLYSETGRNDVVAARTFIAEHRFDSSPAGIRRCRQELLATPIASITRFTDFFSTSECRDLLFHVQESRLTIPQIKAFIAQNNLRFLGFEFDAVKVAHYRDMFAEQGWSMSDLDCWHEVETKHTDTFSGMYQFWVQKG